MDLINGYLSVPEGTVFVNGEDVLALGHNKLREQLVTVSQEPFLFSDTIRNNIALQVDPEDEPRTRSQGGRASDRPWLACHRVCKPWSGKKASHFPAARSNVYHWPGRSLNRAGCYCWTTCCRLLTIVLNANSIEAIYRDADKRATLLVSHRLSVLAQAHRVLVIESGQIKDVGHHDELLERQGPYRDAWLLQRAEEAAAPDSGMKRRFRAWIERQTFLSVHLPTLYHMLKPAIEHRRSLTLVAALLPISAVHGDADSVSDAESCGRPHFAADRCGGRDASPEALTL